jgi:putative transposase
LIEQGRYQYPVKLMCQVARQSRSGYYAWRKRPDRVRTILNRRLVTNIRICHQASDQTYGSPRIHADLRNLGFHCSLNHVARLMQVNDIRAVVQPRQRPKEADPPPECPVVPNVLNRHFAVTRPNRVWLVDITEILTAEGTLYLGLVLDLYSRRIVGWAMAEHRDAQLTSDALTMALGRRRPAADLLHHSDQGSQYRATTYQELLKQHRMVPSMSRKGNPHDNAPMESWIRTLKVELIYRLDLTVWREVKEAIAEYIELFYNSRRRHSALGYLSPAEFERQNGLA